MRHYVATTPAGINRDSAGFAGTVAMGRRLLVILGLVAAVGVGGWATPHELADQGPSRIAFKVGVVNPDRAEAVPMLHLEKVGVLEEPIDPEFRLSISDAKQVISTWRDIPSDHAFIIWGGDGIEPKRHEVAWVVKWSGRQLAHLSDGQTTSGQFGWGAAVVFNQDERATRLKVLKESDFRNGETWQLNGQSSFGRFLSRISSSDGRPSRVPIQFERIDQRPQTDSGNYALYRADDGHPIGPRRHFPLRLEIAFLAVFLTTLGCGLVFVAGWWGYPLALDGRNRLQRLGGWGLIGFSTLGAIGLWWLAAWLGVVLGSVRIRTSVPPNWDNG